MARLTTSATMRPCGCLAMRDIVGWLVARTEDEDADKDRGEPAVATLVDDQHGVHGVHRARDASEERNLPSSQHCTESRCSPSQPWFEQRLVRVTNAPEVVTTKEQQAPQVPEEQQAVSDRQA